MIQTTTNKNSSNRTNKQNSQNGQFGNGGMQMPSGDFGGGMQMRGQN